MFLTIEQLHFHSHTFQTTREHSKRTFEQFHSRLSFIIIFFNYFDNDLRPSMSLSSIEIQSLL